MNKKTKLMNGYSIVAIIFAVLAAIFGGIGTWKARTSIKDEIIDKGDKNTSKIIKAISDKETNNKPKVKIAPTSLNTNTPKNQNNDNPEKRNDYELRKNAIPIFDRTFKIISDFVTSISKTKEYEDYNITNTGYGILENPLRKGHRYGFSNKYYNNIKSLPLNEIIVEDYQYVFKLDDSEYYRISVLKEIDFNELESRIKSIYKEKFQTDLLNNNENSTEDKELRKKAISIFDTTFKIISSFVTSLSKTKEYEDYNITNTGYGIQENPLRKGHRYGLTNKLYNDVKCLPLNEVILIDNNLIFKLDEREYYRTNDIENIDFSELEQVIKKEFTTKFKSELKKK